MNKARNNFYPLLRTLHNCEETLNDKIIKINNSIPIEASLWEVAIFKASILGASLKIKEIRSLRAEVRSTYHVLFKGYGTKTEEVKELKNFERLEAKIKEVDEEVKYYL